MLRLLVGVASLPALAYYLNSRNHYVDLNLNLYEHFYSLLSLRSHSLARSVTDKLMGIDLFYTIPRDSYTSSLCGDLGGIFLPNIIGLEEGHDHSARQLESLFGVGFGFVEVGSFCEAPQFLDNEEDSSSTIAREGNLLQGKANLKSYKNKVFGENSANYPIGVSLKVGKEVREMAPYLAERDFELGCEELIEVGDYLVLNLSTNGQGSLNHLLSTQTLAKLMKNLKERRAYNIGISAILQHEEHLLGDQKKLPNAIYASEIFGRESELTEAFLPKIFIRLDDVEQKHEEIIQVAKDFQVTGIEGIVLKTDKQDLIQKVAVATKGQIPLIVAGNTLTAADVISKVKSGAWAIQLGKNYFERGPSVVQKLLDEVKRELQQNNVRNITELRGVDVN